MSGLWLYMFLVGAVICGFIGYGNWNQYRIYGLISEYYTSVGSFLFSVSLLVYFFVLLMNPNKNISWLSIWLFLIIPAILLNIGIVIRMIYYKGARANLKERIRLMFGIPKSKRSALFPVPNRHLVYSGFVGYVIALILSAVYSPKDFLIITMTILSELFVAVAPLQFENHSLQKELHDKI